MASSEPSSDSSGKCVTSSCIGSDSLCSPVEGEPLSVVHRVVVLDVGSVLVSSNVVLPEECSVSSHSRLDLEFDSISKWVWWVLHLVNLLVNRPSLVGSVVAAPPVDVSSLRVRISMNIKAIFAVVLDVSLVSTDPVHSLVVGVDVLSDDSSSSSSEVVALLAGKNASSIGGLSEGLGSPVEGP